MMRSIIVASNLGKVGNDCVYLYLINNICCFRMVNLHLFHDKKSREELGSRWNTFLAGPGRVNFKRGLKDKKGRYTFIKQYVRAIHQERMMTTPHHIIGA